MITNSIGNWWRRTTGESDERVADGWSGGIDVEREQPGEGVRADVEFCGTEFGVSGLVNGDSVSGASLSSAGSAAGAGVGGSPYSIVITNAVGMG